MGYRSDADPGCSAGGTDHCRRYRLLAGVEAVVMGQGWVMVALVGVATVILEAAGPVLLGGRPLPPKMMGLIELLAPALLAALIVTQVLGEEPRIVFDARLVGAAAAGLALWARSPLLPAIAIAAAATAITRAIA
ncbi:MAG: AzlD domain-containing protein [Acidimicrobiia bacterium]